MSKFFIGFALAVAFVAALSGMQPTAASAQTTPTPTPSASPMSTMQP